MPGAQAQGSLHNTETRVSATVITPANSQVTPSLADLDLQLTEDTWTVPAEIKRITHLGPPQIANRIMVQKKEVAILSQKILAYISGSKFWGRFVTQQKLTEIHHK